MAKVLIVYATDYGNTKKMAEALAKGVKENENVSCKVIEAEKATVEDVKEADGLVLGSPVHMGSCDWRVKRFIDTVCGGLWMKDALVGRVGAVFASGSGYGSAGGGCELTLLSMMNNLVELGLLIVPLPKNTPGYVEAGMQWGPYARSAGLHMEQVGVSEAQLVSSFHHGKNIGRVCAIFESQKVFA